ncbi:hypothetical protein, partial [Saccharopolyspora elongata]
MDEWHNANNADIAGNLLQVGRADQIVMNLSGHSEPPAPNMLTINPEHFGFTNRTAELARLDRLWRDAERAGKPLIVVLRVPNRMITCSDWHSLMVDHDRVKKGEQPPWIVSDELWERIEP